MNRYNGLSRYWVKKLILWFCADVTATQSSFVTGSKSQDDQPVLRAISGREAPMITAAQLYDYNTCTCPHRIARDLFDDVNYRDPINPFIQLLWITERYVAVSFSYVP